MSLPASRPSLREKNSLNVSQISATVCERNRQNGKRSCLTTGREESTIKLQGTWGLGILYNMMHPLTLACRGEAADSGSFSGGNRRAACPLRSRRAGTPAGTVPGMKPVGTGRRRADPAPIVGAGGRWRSHGDGGSCDADDSGSRVPENKRPKKCRALTGTDVAYRL